MRLNNIRCSARFVLLLFVVTLKHVVSCRLSRNGSHGSNVAGMIVSSLYAIGASNVMLGSQTLWKAAVRLVMLKLLQDQLLLGWRFLFPSFFKGRRQHRMRNVLSDSCASHTSGQACHARTKHGELTILTIAFFVSVSLLLEPRLLLVIFVFELLGYGFLNAVEYVRLLEHLERGVD